MVTEINDFDPMPDELEIDCVDRAIVPVADRHSGENANWRSHQAKSLMVII
jgi:hypothetical protein